MLLLTVTTNHRHGERIMAVAREVVGSDAPYLLFTVAPMFGDPLCVPDLCPDLLTAPWRRVGHADLRIDEPHAAY